MLKTLMKKRSFVYGGFSFLFLALIVFFMFGSLQVPILSDLGDKILGKQQQDVKGIEENKEVIDEAVTEKELPEGEVVEEAVKEAVKEDMPLKEDVAIAPTPKSVVPKPAQASVPTPAPVPTPEPNQVIVYSCHINLIEEYSQQYCNALVSADEMGQLASATLSNANSVCNSWITDPIFDMDKFTECIDEQIAISDSYTRSQITFHASAQNYKELLLGCGLGTIELSELENRCR